MDVTVNKTACPKQTMCRLNDLAWNNKGSTVESFFLLVFKTQSGNPEHELHSGSRLSSLFRRLGQPDMDRVSIGINRSSRGDTYCCASGEILRPQQDELLRKHFASMFSLIKNESVGIEDD